MMNMESEKIHNCHTPEYDYLIKSNMRSKFRQYITAIIANIITFAFGTVNGWPSPAQSMLQSSHPPVGTVPLTDDEISWLGSIVFMGGVVGTFIWSQVADKLGRKVAGYMTALPFLMSWLMMIYATNYWSLFIARFIVGIGCTGTLINVPLIVGEMADDTLRGPLGSSLILFLNGGYLFSYVVGAFSSFKDLNTLCLIVPVIFLLTFYWIPESPAFLISQNKLDKAKKSLLWFRGDDHVAADKEMKFLVGQNESKPHVNISALFSDRGVFKGFMIGFILIMGQQVSGINFVLTYTASIFEAAGSKLEPNICTIIVGILQLIASVFSCIVVNKAGRKLLLLLTYFGIAVALGTMGFCYYLIDIGQDISSISSLPIIALSLYVCCYSLGAGPVPYILFSEILPGYIRNFATSVTIMFGIFGSFLTVKIYPTLNALLGKHGTFLFYAFCSLMIFFYTILFVPETKGRSLQSILKDLKGVDKCVLDETASDLSGSRSSKLEVNGSIQSLSMKAR